ncbi:MAG: ABC transporter ATP-binding protein [Desulfobacterales bacterium]|jgi:branched-chain amino acid transport system ATP-binding protein
MKNEVILQTRDLTMRFGGLTAVKDFNIAVPRGGMVGLIGPNGAGKTTCFNMITGFYSPSGGAVIFEGRDITGAAPHEVCKAGIARTFQNIRLFANQTALQNVMIGAHLRQQTTWWHVLLSLPGCLREEKALREKARHLLEIVGLADHGHEKATSLPYGAQRRLEIARALATEPAFLLLDEPAAGMNPQETEHLMAFIRSIREQFNLTILLIEHDMKVVMGICEQIWVLDYGETIAVGSPEEIRSDAGVIEAYLGKESVANA